MTDTKLASAQRRVKLAQEIIDTLSVAGRAADEYQIEVSRLTYPGRDAIAARALLAGIEQQIKRAKAALDASKQEVQYREWRADVHAAAELRKAREQEAS